MSPEQQQAKNHTEPTTQPAEAVVVFRAICRENGPAQQHPLETKLK